MSRIWNLNSRKMAVLGWLVGLVIQCAACATTRPGDPPAIEAPYSITGHRSGHALFYIVPLPENKEEVVLVDTGFEQDARSIKAALGHRKVRAILLTHGHTDHWSGAGLFNVPVYVGAADVGLITGQKHSRGLLPHIGEHILPKPPTPQHLVAVVDRQVVKEATATFRAISLPGHTQGSTAWLYRDVLFGGDALMGNGEKLSLSPFIFSDDPKQALRSLKHLKGIEFHTLLDGHAGLTTDAQEKLHQFLHHSKDSQ